MSTPNPDPASTASASPTIALEEKLSFQQRQLDELNSVIVEQQSEIERLRREVVALTQLVRGVMDRSGENLPHEKPPHY